nr:MAG TPA_asm: hypothetical protein [Caudoviricetes sp.]
MVFYINKAFAKIYLAKTIFKIFYKLGVIII